MLNRKEKVLIVDDEPAARKLIARILSGEGYQCDEASSGEKALEILEINKAGLVILDIRMPGKSGVEILPEIKIGYPGTAVIMVTAVNDISTAVDCIKMGAEDYICKPFRKEEFIPLVEKTLRKRNQHIGIDRKKQSLGDQVPPVLKEKVLACLNSIESPQELKNTMNRYTGKPTFGTLSAKRIIDAREKLGEFKNLQEVVVLRGIGEKRFNILINALDSKD